MWEPRKDIGGYVVQNSLTLKVAMTKPRRMGGQRERRFATKTGAQKAADEMNAAKDQQEGALAGSGERESATSS